MGGGDLQGASDAIATALARGDALLLLTDYDGTLAPIADDPAATRLSPVVRDHLRVLARAAHVTVGIVSGRGLDDLKSQVRVAEAIYAGCQGLEIDGPGLSFRHPEAAARQWVLQDIARRLMEHAASVPGVVVESKGLSLAVHYRRVAEGRVPELLELVAGATLPWRDGIRILRGVKALEILPIRVWDKGRCAAWLLEEVRTAGRGPVFTVYLGDDETDELVFGSLTGDGVTVRVGEGPPTLATYRLGGVGDVHRLLSALAAHVTPPAAG